MKLPTYSVATFKIGGDEAPYGPEHLSFEANTTLCGRHIDRRFKITHSQVGISSDCPKCLQVLGHLLLEYHK